MKISPLLSIIVPVYNAERDLHRCIRSILEQTFSDFELLLIDDGSTDASGVICEEFALKDGRVLVLHKENGGVSSARNVGLDYAKGKWIAFVDSDDWADCDFLSAFVQAMDNNGNSLIVQRSKCFRREELEYILHDNFNSKVSVNEFLLDAKYGYLWNKVFKHSIIKKNKIRFDCNMDCFEDEIFVLQYIQNVCEVVILPVSFYNYQLPEFNVKYKGKTSFENQIYRYIKVKEYSAIVALGLVDWMVMTMFDQCAEQKRKYTMLLKGTIGSDIRGCLGFRKCILRQLAKTNNNFIWSLIVGLYFYLYKLRLL